jgi:Ser/Thr protein kinase RdoA (MazF antagonist)
MLSDNLLGYAAGRYDFNRDTLQFVADGNYSAKQFYSFTRYEKPYMLRFAKRHAGHLSRTKAEMDWLCYLAEKGVSVSRPFKTANGELAVTAAENGETYIIAAYSKAEGRLFDVNDPDLWNEKVFYNWGKVMGDMHRETKGYGRAEEADRHSDIANNINAGIKRFPAANKIAEDLLSEIKALPKGIDSYGLVHADLGPSNFLIDGDRINVFDFDDCTYTWFANDIGAALTFGIWFGRHNDAGYDFANDIFRNFLAGYLSANHLDDFWLSKIPLFLRLYQIAGFAHMNHRLDPDNENQQEQIRNIENNILISGSSIDYSIFKMAN